MQKTKKKVFLFCIIDILNEKAKDLKDYQWSSILHFSLSFPPHPRFFFFFFHIQKELKCNNLTYTTTLSETAYFLERDHFLFGINYRRRDMQSP